MNRRGFMPAAGTGLAASGLALGSPPRSPETTYLVAHGAWSAGWAWKKMHPLYGGMVATATPKTLSGRSTNAPSVNTGRIRKLMRATPLT